MKTLFTTAIAALMGSFALAQQEQTLTLQPDADQGKDALIWYVPSQRTVHGPTNTTNYGTHPDLQANAWTWKGSAGTRRSLVQFDFSSIPANAIITEASLSLYYNPTNGDGKHSQLSGSNEVLIQKVTEAWQEDQVTWNTQPAATEMGQVELAASTSETQDYLDIDVKGLVQTMIGDGNNNGFLIKLKTESHYRRIVFASSDNKNTDLHPKLVIKYTVPLETLFLKPNAAQGKDALIWYVPSQTTVHGPTNTTNYGTNPDLQANAWTWKGSAGTRRSLVEFDLSSIPANAVVKNASLSLYYNPTNGDGKHSQLSGSNEVLIQKVTEAWQENQVTWNTQPAATEVGQVELAASTSETQDYLDIDVKGLVQTMIGDGNNNGFLIKLKTESHYRRIVFASSDNKNADLHPELVIEYEVPVVTDIEEKVTQETTVIVYPNPFSISTTFDLGEVAEYSVALYSVDGQLVKTVTEDASQIEVLREGLATGLYFYQVTTESGVVAVGKLIVE